MGELLAFALHEYGEQASAAVAQRAAEFAGHPSEELRHWPDHVEDCMVVACKCGWRHRVTRHIWAEWVEEEAVKLARKAESPFVGVLAMHDAVAHVRENPSGLSQEELQADALKAVDDRDIERAERRVAELLLPPDREGGAPDG